MNREHGQSDNTESTYNGKNKDIDAISDNSNWRSGAPTLAVLGYTCNNSPSSTQPVRTGPPHPFTHSLHYFTLPKPKTFNTTQVQTSEIAIPSSPAHLLTPTPFIDPLDALVRIVSGLGRLSVRRWSIIGLGSCVDGVGFGCVVLFVRVAGCGFLGLGFFVEAVA